MGCRGAYLDVDSLCTHTEEGPRGVYHLTLSVDIVRLPRRGGEEEGRWSRVDGLVQAGQGLAVALKNKYDRAL